MAETVGIEYWGLCDGCEHRRPQVVRDVGTATVCNFHVLQEWHDPMGEPKHVEGEW